MKRKARNAQKRIVSCLSGALATKGGVGGKTPKEGAKKRGGKKEKAWCRRISQRARTSKKIIRKSWTNKRGEEQSGKQKCYRTR